MKDVRYLPKARRSLQRHANVADRIIKVVSEYAAGDGAHANQVKSLHGTLGKRLRVGDFRVLFDETDTIIEVLDVGPRSKIYE